MRIFFQVVCALLFFAAATIAGESPQGSRGPVDCAGNPAAGNNRAAANNGEGDGFTVFPIQAPQRYIKEKKAGSEMPEDSAFANSLRMILGLSGSKSPDCFKQPRVRGLLRDE